MLNYLKVCLNILCLIVMVLSVSSSFPMMIVAQEVSSVPIYDVMAEVDVLGDNYVKARQQAVNAAMREAVKVALEEMLGSEVYKANHRLLRKTIARARRYVRGYRFLESNDNSVEMIVEVHLEVTLFTEILRKKLLALGILTAPGAEGTVVILIKENSVSVPDETGFWDHIPFAETALAKGFEGAGFLVVKRNKLRGRVSEETALEAVHGDIETATDIGLKTGADMVIVGNAISKRMSGQSALDLQTVRANISLKVVSPSNSVIIAAKSDFATADGEDVVTGEQEAFDKVCEKLSGFLVDSIRKHRDKKTEIPATPQPQLSKPPALSLTDL
ncbi:MAG: hypothetical protein VYC17_00510 [Nitrospinota bacterium]|nr:hypothetical protein [Nitrospinota bacterium]